MKSRAVAALLVILCLAGATCAQLREAPGRSLRFQAIDLYIDTQGQPLAAWQLEFQANSPDVKIAGIEGGEHPVYQEPPYYDTQAIQHERVILADFSTLPAPELPAGRVRIATIHVQVPGSQSPEFTVKLMAAAAANGEEISANLTARERTEE